ncbi:MAG TPA: hypothetical protein VFY79_05520 [Dehalococcoidia bacterium]|nr:hypothetical protein [Dehalococcoidia bacterium]
MRINTRTPENSIARYRAYASAILTGGAAGSQGIASQAVAWARTAEPDLRGFARRRWAELLAAAVALYVVAYLVYLFTRYPLPPGTDAGQWLTISRYYLGEHVPVDRTVSTVPPVVPLALAALTMILPDRTLAIVALAAASYVAIAGLAFLLGRRMTGDAAGGMLAVVLVAVAQGGLFDYFSMGAYPQLAGVIGMSVSLLGLLRVAEDEGDRRGWLLISGGTLLTMFSHTPSATVLLPVLACCLGWRFKASDDRGRIVAASVVSIAPVLVVWCGFLLLNGSSIFGYANVAAAYDLKGPDKLFLSVWNDPNERMIYGATFIALAGFVLGARDARLRSPRRTMLAVWIAATLALILASAARHTNTDYPRFAAYLVVPVGVAAAAAIHYLARNPAVIAAVAVCVATLAGQHSLYAFNRATSFYGMNANGAELTAAGDWLNTDAQPGAITGGTREVKWLEALTGRDSLLYLPRIYITRPWEVDSAIAAEVLQRASAGVETGRFLATVNDGGEDSGHVFPVGLRVDVFHKGIYSNAFSLNDRDVKLALSAYGSTQEVTLTSGARPLTATSYDGSVRHVLTYYALTAQKAEVIRDVSADSSLPRTLQVDYYVGTINGVTPASLSLNITQPDGTSVAAIDGGSSFEAALFDGSQVPIDMTTGWERSANLALPPSADGTLVWRKISLRLQVNGSERRIDDTRLYDETSVFAQYGVRYVIDRNGDGAAFPLIRDRGLVPVYENDQYRIYDVGTH